MGSSSLQQKWKEQVFSARDALKKHPERLYAVKPLFPFPSVSIVYGQPGCLKTNLMLDLAVCVATGTKWLAGESVEPFEVMQGPVMWFDADSGQDELHRRLGAILRAHGGSETTPVHYGSFLMPDFDARKVESVKAAIELITDYACHLVVFDNLAVFSGGADENTSQMIPVMKSFRYISEETGAALILIHHEPVNSDKKRPRGFGGINGAQSISLNVERDGDILTLTPTKVRGAPVYRFAAMWSWQKLPGKSLDLKEARFYGMEVETDPKMLLAREVILEAISSKSNNGHEVNQKEIIGVCKSKKIGRPTAVSELNWLIYKDKVIARINQSHRSTFYTLKR